MTPDEIREGLEIGGYYLSAAMNWLRRNKGTRGKSLVKMTVQEIEEMALEVAVAALSKDLIWLERSEKWGH